MLSFRTNTIIYQLNIEQEGLAVASIARDVVVEMTTMRGKFGLEFET